MRAQRPSTRPVVRSLPRLPMALAGLLALGSSAASAQAAEPDPDYAAAVGSESAVSATAAAPQPASRTAPEELVVTGSRIQRTNVDGVGPLSVIDAEDIALSGKTTIDDLLLDLPSVGFQGISQNNNNGGDGLAFIDLRNLGVSRTLVLLDGRRFPVSSTGTGDGVDLNNVPVALIDRVEVLRDGASAVYGSDAVAGVVNFKFKDRFDGLQLDVLTGMTQYGDGAQNQLSLTTGRQFGRANVLFNATGFDRNVIRQKDRQFSRSEITGLAGDGSRIFGSSLVPEGRVETGDGLVFFRPDKAAAKSFQPLSSQRTDQRFDFGRFQNLVPEVSRLSLSGLANYEFSDSVQAYVQTLYTKRDGEQQLAPTPIGGAGTTVNPLGLLVPLGQFPQDFRDGVRAGTIQLGALDPNAISDQSLVPVARRLTEAGPRIFEQNSDSLRFVAGLRGELAASSLGPWKWDTFFNYGRTDTDQDIKNSINLSRAIIAADPVRCAAVRGCVPANFIGAGSLSAKQLAFFRFNEHDELRFALRNYGVSASGPIWQLPAGLVQLAVGAEYRRESGFFRPSSVKVNGDSANNQVTATRGDFTVREAFYELEVPLLRGVRGVEELTANLAGRITDYNTFGSDFNYRYALSWAPVQQLRFRAAASTSFRAPGISDLFGGAADDFRVLSDPCSGVGADSSATLRANCAADGVPDGFMQRDSQIRRTVGGDPNLQPEESDFFGAGFVWTPTFMPEFSFTTDYYDIEIDNALDNPDSQFLLDACYASANLSDPSCARIDRSSVTGAITRLEASLSNIGKVETNGVEFELRYAFRMPVLGTVQVRGAANYVIDFEETLPSGKRQINGTISSTDSNVANFRGSLTTTVAPVEKIFLSTTVNYLGSAEAEEGGLSSRVTEVWYLDTALRYDLNETWTLGLGLQNALNRKPPRFLNMANSEPNAYDFTGRFGFARLSARF